MYFSTWGFLDSKSVNIVLLFKCFLCFIERETQNVILELGEIFLWREAELRAHGMKSDEKPFFCQIYAIVWGKMVHAVIDRYFFFISERFEDFS